MSIILKNATIEAELLFDRDTLSILEMIMRNILIRDSVDDKDKEWYSKVKKKIGKQSRKIICD